MNERTAFIAHTIATDPLPPPPRKMYEYLFAGNGIFLRAQRDGLTACIPHLLTPIQGLPDLHPRISLTGPPITQNIMSTILSEALQAWKHPGGPEEALFHCTYTDHWSLTIPDQIRTYASVHCRNPFTPSSNTCLVEIHSHHEMPAYFSDTDNEDETGFRVFGVLGHFHRKPRILFRVGIYGHFFSIPADTIAELPAGLSDAFADDNLYA